MPALSAYLEASFFPFFLKCRFDMTRGGNQSTNPRDGSAHHPVVSTVNWAGKVSSPSLHTKAFMTRSQRRPQACFVRFDGVLISAQLLW
jgi:hypothetical protein